MRRRALTALPGFRGLLVVLGYTVVGLAVLGRSLWPGRTVVPVDILAAFPPYTALAGGHRPYNPILSDAAIQFFPWMQFFGDSLRRGGLPRWNPLILGGVPVAPNGFVGPDYPGFWLVRLVHPLDAYGLFVLVHLVAAAAGVYLLSRLLGVRPWPAWVTGALAFAAGMWVHWSLHLVHLVGFAGIPWVLAAAHSVISRPSPRAVAALGAVFGLWWLGGNPQYTYYGSLAMAVYMAALLGAHAQQRLCPRRGRLLVPVLACGAGLGMGVLVALPALLPMARVSSSILRSREPVQSVVSHPPAGELVRVVVPDATGNPVDGVALGSNDEARMDSPSVGVSAVVLGGAGLLALARSRRPALALGLAVALVVVVAFAAPANRLLYAVVPAYDRFRNPTRWLAVLPAFALPLAAIGLQSLTGGERGARAGAWAAGLVALVAVAVWWYRWHAQPSAPRAFVTSRAGIAAVLILALVLAAQLSRAHRVAAWALILICLSVDVGLASGRWYPSIDKRLAYPAVRVARVAGQRGGRIFRVGRSYSLASVFSANVPMVYRVADGQGQTTMFPADYDRYLRIVHDYGGFAAAFNTAPDLPPGSAVRSPLLDALDVRTIAAEPGMAVVGYQLLAPAKPGIESVNPIVYARTSPGPAVVVARAEPSDLKGMWRSVAAPDWDPRRRAAVVGLDRAVEGGSGEVMAEAAGVDRERWRVHAPRGGFLRVSGRYDQGWLARVDGRRVAVFRADGIFRGVVVPPGAHDVTFRYRNRPQDLGRRLAVVGWALVVILALVPLGPRRRS